ncbi:hypothetical protein BS47DRAFT_1363921 [Hydnum rufescens UP504]|uniref:Uncharacterized protein n=1 Tax=Hydnum rufescens UP504 TaxID=1448309 RepID=A0A9P6ASU6_9AGAM|nr:hypothetical protein BS47DRAFT_1363921 [Hydnum rufescens UP504]
MANQGKSKIPEYEPLEPEGPPTSEIEKGSECEKSKKQHLPGDETGSSKAKQQKLTPKPGQGKHLSEVLISVCLNLHIQNESNIDHLSDLELVSSDSTNQMTYEKLMWHSWSLNKQGDLQLEEITFKFPILQGERDKDHEDQALDHKQKHPSCIRAGCVKHKEFLIERTLRMPSVIKNTTIGALIDEELEHNNDSPRGNYPAYTIKDKVVGDGYTVRGNPFPSHGFKWTIFVICMDPASFSLKCMDEKNWFIKDCLCSSSWEVMVIPPGGTLIQGWRNAELSAAWMIAQIRAKILLENAKTDGSEVYPEWKRLDESLGEWSKKKQDLNPEELRKLLLTQGLSHETIEQDPDTKGGVIHGVPTAHLGATEKSNQVEQLPACMKACALGTDSKMDIYWYSSNTLQPHAAPPNAGTLVQTAHAPLARYKAEQPPSLHPIDPPWAKQQPWQDPHPPELERPVLPALVGPVPLMGQWLEHQEPHLAEIPGTMAHWEIILVGA